MRFSFTAEQQLFQRSVRDLLAVECTSKQVRAMSTDPIGRSPERWQKLADLGVAALTVPEIFGGLGLGPLDWVLVCEEAGYAALPEPLLETVAVATPLLVALGSTDLQELWLPKVARGEALLTVGFDHALHPQSKDTQDQPGLVADAHFADLLLLTHKRELHAVAPADAKCTLQPSADGTRRLFHVDWTPTDATRIAGGEKAVTEIAKAVNRGALATAAALVGLARRMIEMAVEYAKVRQQFGQPIGAFQAVKHHLADAHLAVEFARPVVYHAAYALQRGDSSLHNTHAALHIAHAKARASDAALLAAKKTLQCHGAIGYSYEYDLHLWMKRAWALSAAYGDPASHRTQIAQTIL